MDEFDPVEIHKQLLRDGALLDSGTLRVTIVPERVPADGTSDLAIFRTERAATDELGQRANRFLKDALEASPEIQPIFDDSRRAVEDESGGARCFSFRRIRETCAWS